MTHPSLESTLALRHATPVDDPELVVALVQAEGEEGLEDIAGYISERGRVVAWVTPTGDRILYESEIEVLDDDEWRDRGTARVYRFQTADENDILADTRRRFLSQSLANGGAVRVAGWRDRIVALIPEEVGPKESKIIRTLPDGDIQATHTYTVLDAFAKYGEWVNQLAAEFGSSDVETVSERLKHQAEPVDPISGSIAQAWLMREAAQAQLDQARASLQFSLAGFARMQRFPDGGVMSVAELARSLHTDRPNLSRAIKSAEKVPAIANVLDSLAGASGLSTS